MVTVYRVAPRPPAELTAYLAPADLEHALTYRDPTARARAATGRALQRAAVAHHLGRPLDEVAIVRRCPACDGAHGRPEVAGQPGLHVSASYSGGIVLVAVADVPLGIDVEQCSAVVFSGFDDVALTRQERAELTALDESARDEARADLWAKKEAVLKLTGEGLNRSPDTLHVGLDTTRISDPRAVLTELAIDPAYHAWVATETEHEVTLRDGVPLLAVAAGSARTTTA